MVDANKVKNTTRGRLISDTEVLRAIVEGTATSTGDEFFGNLVRHVAEGMHARRAFISEFVTPSRIRTIAYWCDGRIADNFEFELAGTPCEVVLTGKTCHYPKDVHKLFPREVGVESYVGAPMVDQDGSVLGHLCVMDESPRSSADNELHIFEIITGRAAAELNRLKAERKLAENEARLKDLFDEAPIAYVHEDLDSRFIRANKSAQRILGITPDQVPGFFGKSLVPETPEAQQRVKDALESIGKGDDAEGLVLELRRKDNGEPLWVQWWSRPDPSGAFTRTMFIDITERILLESEKAHLAAQNEYLREEIKSTANFDEIVGSSNGLNRALENVRRVAPTAASVLILGETGTGKELIARAIHSVSNRADKPFVKVNCAALPPGLIESELFGHERGAFSGAIQKRVGRFELAHKGTLFLDEVGEIPLEVQVKLLRVLQEKQFSRIGSNDSIDADVRIISATNRDLPQSVREGRFREELFYRLNVFPIQLPPLRKRVEDIPQLALFFVQKYAPQFGSKVESIDRRTMQLLLGYPWPGNIRELENIIQRAVILADSTALSADASQLGLPLTSGHTGSAQWAVTMPSSDSSAPQESLNQVQREHILNVLQETGWVVEGQQGAARRLGMKPATLRHRMKKLGIDRPKAEL